MKWKQRLLLLRRVQIECFSLRAFYGADLLGCLVSLLGGWDDREGRAGRANEYIYIFVGLPLYIYARERGNKLLWVREGLNIDQLHVPGNKLLWEREREAEHRPGTCPGK